MALDHSLWISETLTIPAGGFGVILLDPPYHYRDRLDHPNMRGGAEATYGKGRVLKPEDLANLNLDALAADDCALFCWTTGPQMAVTCELFAAWKWRFVTMAFVWRKMYSQCRKPVFSTGRWTRSTYEYVLLAVRGRPKRIHKGIRQEVQRVRGAHSEKPPIVRERIDRLMGLDIPKVELFARNLHAGWQGTGFELDGVDIRDTPLWKGSPVAAHA